MGLFRDGIKISHRMVSPAREGWVVFDVLDDLNRVKDELNKQPHRNRNITFTIKTYKNQFDLALDHNGEDCYNSSLKFQRKPQSSVYPPLLMIYSKDDNFLKLNVSAILKNISRPSNVSSKISRTKRSTSCGRHTLDITVAQFNEVWQLGNSQITALAPYVFHLGVCGGQCNINYYPNGSPQHSVILYYLASRHPAPNNMSWTECCAPVEYDNLEFLFRNGDNYIITPLWEVSVSRCACLRTVSMTSSRLNR